MGLFSFYFASNFGGAFIGFFGKYSKYFPLKSLIENASWKRVRIVMESYRYHARIVLNPFSHRARTVLDSHWNRAGTMLEP